MPLSGFLHFKWPPGLPDKALRMRTLTAWSAYLGSGRLQCRCPNLVLSSSQSDAHPQNTDPTPLEPILVLWIQPLGPRAHLSGKAPGVRFPRPALCRQQMGSLWTPQHAEANPLLSRYGDSHPVKWNGLSIGAHFQPKDFPSQT